MKAFLRLVLECFLLYCVVYGYCFFNDAPRLDAIDFHLNAQKFFLADSLHLVTTIWSSLVLGGLLLSFLTARLITFFELDSGVLRFLFIAMMLSTTPLMEIVSQNQFFGIQMLAYIAASEAVICAYSLRHYWSTRGGIIVLLLFVASILVKEAVLFAGLVAIVRHFSARFTQPSYMRYVMINCAICALILHCLALFSGIASWLPSPNYDFLHYFMMNSGYYMQQSIWSSASLLPVVALFFLLFFKKTHILDLFYVMLALLMSWYVGPLGLAFALASLCCFSYQKLIELRVHSILLASRIYVGTALFLFVFQVYAVAEREKYEIRYFKNLCKQFDELEVFRMTESHARRQTSAIVLISNDLASSKEIDERNSLLTYLKLPNIHWEQTTSTTPVVAMDKLACWPQHRSFYWIGDRCYVRVSAPIKAARDYQFAI